MARVFLEAAHRAAPYYKAGRNGPLAETSPLTFTYECLVRALDHRLAVKLGKSAEVERRVAAVVDRETSQGLRLVRPFYDLLSGREQSGKSFDAHLPALLDRLSVLE